MNLHAVAQLLLVGSFVPFLEAATGSGSLEGGGALAAVWDWAGLPDGAVSLTWLGGLVVVAVVFANAVGAVHGIAVARFSAGLNARLSSRLLRNYLMRPYVYHLGHNSSEFLRTIFSEVDFVSDGFLEAGLNAVARFLTIVGLGVVLLLVHPGVTLLAGGFLAGSYSLIYLLLRRRLVAAAETRSECDDARYQAVAEAFGTVKEVKVMQRERFFLEAFEKPSRRYFRNLEKAQIYSELPRHLVETIAFAGMVGVALVLLREKGGMSGALPVLGLFAVAGYRLLPAIKGFYTCVSQMRYFRGSVETVYRECVEAERAAGERREMEERETRTERLPFRRAIELREVSFSYPGGSRAAVSGVDLTIPVRARVGFCGRSGSGKTTLADIVLGLLEPDSGRILVDGVGLDSGNRAAWQRNCGYVPQQIFLTDDTIRSNIAFGVPVGEIDDERVRAAARLANLGGFIEAGLPEGYETKVGERGVRLSGGQRQRIGIARALYHDPEVIVLDEATSSLDAETERAIVEAVQSLAGRKTILMIAHRLSTIRESDLLVFLEEGEVRAVGSYAELVAGNEGFRRLAEMSAEGGVDGARGCSGAAAASGRD